MIKKILFKIKLISVRLISWTPSNTGRVFLYKILFSYNINSSVIGWGTMIIADNVFLDNCIVGRNNYFRGPLTIKIDSGAKIGSNNRFISGYWTVADEQNKSQYKRFLHVGRNSLITSDHYFDLAGSFTLGQSSWVAGNGSQFWTHGAGVRDRDIIVGKNCYIGSAVRFSTGVTIADNCIVGIGSIVTKKFTNEYVLIAGNPAKIVRENFDWKIKYKS